MIFTVASIVPLEVDSLPITSSLKEWYLGMTPMHACHYGYGHGGRDGGGHGEGGAAVAGRNDDVRARPSRENIYLSIVDTTYGLLQNDIYLTS